MPTTYDELIDRVQRAARYVGGELHSIVKDWDAPDAPEVRIALAYPDLYDLGMSNLGLGILYDIVNRREDALAERVFSPWTDFEDLLRAHGEPLRSLETRHALHEFDLLGISLSYEVCFTNVLNLLDLGGIPIRSADRSEDDPIILGGGSAALEPEPMAPFFDAFALGEGEELIDELVDFVRDWKRAGRGSRLELHRALAAIDGVYVPSLYEASYRPDGTLEATRPIDEAAPASVTRRVMQVLPPPLTKPIVPFMEVVHDRAAIEIQRGCTQGCRFCQAGMIYRPTRERSVEEVVAAAGELLDNTGYHELSLMSLSTTEPPRHRADGACADGRLRRPRPEDRPALDARRLVLRRGRGRRGAGQEAHADAGSRGRLAAAAQHDQQARHRGGQCSTPPSTPSATAGPASRCTSWSASRPRPTTTSRRSSASPPR